MIVKLENDFCKIENNNLKSQLTKKGIGFKKELDFYIDLYETFYLFCKNKITVKKDSKNLSKKEILEICKKNIKDFENKFLVYEDLKNQGYIVKDGTSFGFDFRVYKNKNEHTEFVVDVIKSQKDTINKIIKSERLATTINAKCVLAIVSLEKKIIKIKIEKL